MKMIERNWTKTWNSYLATAYAEGFCEGENATEKERIEAFQWLIDNKLAWNLQGWFGRTAEQLINAGLCKPADIEGEGWNGYEEV